MRLSLNASQNFNYLILRHTGGSFMSDRFKRWNFKKNSDIFPPRLLLKNCLYKFLKWEKILDAEPGPKMESKRFQ